jgi:hypothetical protein
MKNPKGSGYVSHAQPGINAMRISRIWMSALILVAKASTDQKRCHSLNVKPVIRRSLRELLERHAALVLVKRMNPIHVEMKPSSDIAYL